MRVQVEQDGARQWRDALRLMGLRVDAATREATVRSGRIVERSVKIYLRTYTHPAGTPTPSPPGGPPALVSGNLMRSIHQSAVRRQRHGVYATDVGPLRLLTRYQRIQELGGRAGRGHRTRLPARPYLKPRTRAELDKIRRTYAEHWREATRT